MELTWMLITTKIQHIQPFLAHGGNFLDNSQIWTMVLFWEGLPHADIDTKAHKSIALKEAQNLVIPWLKLVPS